MHKRGLENLFMIISGTCFPGPEVFVSLLMCILTRSSSIVMSSNEILIIELPRLPDNSNSKTDVFNVNFMSPSFSEGPYATNKSNILFTSQVDLYLGKFGLQLNTPFMKRFSKLSS